MKETSISKTQRMSNHIEEYFADNTASKEVLTSKELFRAEEKDIDVKTDLILKEIILINKLKYNDIVLKDSGLEQVYSKFLNNYEKLKISLDRKSRTEFVDMNRGQSKTDDVLDAMSKVSNITGAKK